MSCGQIFVNLWEADWNCVFYQTDIHEASQRFKTCSCINIDSQYWKRRLWNIKSISEFRSARFDDGELQINHHNKLHLPDLWKIIKRGIKNLLMSYRFIKWSQRDVFYCEPILRQLCFNTWMIFLFLGQKILALIPLFLICQSLLIAFGMII